MSLNIIDVMDTIIKSSVVRRKSQLEREKAIHADTDLNTTLGLSDKDKFFKAAVTKILQ